MATIKVTTDSLFQGGRVNSPDTSVQPSYLRYSAIPAANDTTEFQFPTATSGQQTFGVPMTVFVDNALNNFVVQVSVAATGQTFPIPANSTGFYLLDAIAGSTVTITSAGTATGAVEFIFYNYSRTPFVWYKFGSVTSAVTIADGADVALGSTTDAAITNAASNGTLIAFTKGIVSKLSGTLTVTSTVLPDNYESVAASQTNQILGSTGAAGDRLDYLTIQPATTSPGNVIIKDGSTTIFTFPGGASSVSNLVPFIVPLSAGAATNWNITTGTNVSCIGTGKFT